jgi:hypothetical protein
VDSGIVNAQGTRSGKTHEITRNADDDAKCVSLFPRITIESANMKRAGRNDPCPCGSGKKYKKCCLNAVDASDSVYRLKERTESNLVPRLVEYALDRFPDESRREAWDEFNGMEGVELPEEDSLINLVFIPWYLFNCPFEDVYSPPDSLVTIAEVFLEANEDELTEDEISYLNAAIGLPYSLYELLEVKPSVGLKLRDLFTRKELDVVEPSLQESFEPGGVLYGAIMEFGGLNWIFGFVPLPLAVEFKKSILEARSDLTKLLERDELTEMDVMDFEEEIRSLYFGLVSQMLGEIGEEALEALDAADDAEVESLPLFKNAAATSVRSIGTGSSNPSRRTK